MEKINKFVNKSVRLKDYDYNLPGACFITICLKDRKCLFGEVLQGKIMLNNMGIVAENCWKEIPNHFENVEPGPHIMMPNHMHGIIFILDNSENKKRVVGQTHAFDSPRRALDLQSKVSQNNLMHTKLSTVIGSYKSSVTKEINLSINQPDFKWQTSFHDHIIRNEKEMQNIADYIELNPTNWDEDFENVKYRTRLTDKERKNLLKKVYESFM